ncbi:hypothetical protein [Nocardia terpenica]|uniref:Uncharacterized protein n=1 Tax=Nocardia terpenica TaxID=455432 RepID=A0A161ZAG4_9NOCA|nr:hypothetical protein [Nocardia terpenica]KZM76162.1 hypothetical protein AWN90_00070 [Nocardia terpenica]NQE90350.1 hypothetical protein [Nocardia terpenica]
MKSGLVTETCVIAYCSECGDAFGTELGCGHPLLFDSVDEAIAFLTDRVTAAGWLFDGERLACDGCLTAMVCETKGHEWGDWQPYSPVVRLGELRWCEHCGEIETREIR